MYNVRIRLPSSHLVVLTTTFPNSQPSRYAQHFRHTILSSFFWQYCTLNSSPALINEFSRNKKSGSTFAMFYKQAPSVLWYKSVDIMQFSGKILSRFLCVSRRKKWWNAEIENYGLAYNLIMKFLKMSNYLCRNYHLCVCVCVCVWIMFLPLYYWPQLCSTWKCLWLGPSFKDRKLLLQTFSNGHQVGEMKYFRKW